MPDITIFDSRGYRLGDTDGSRDSEIKRMNKYGVVFSVVNGRPPELTVYFRARESSSGRLEQYYARYVPDAGPGSLNIGFADDIKRYAEAEHDLSVADSTGGENFLGTLLARPDTNRTVGMIRDRDRAQQLLKQGQRLRFGTGSYEDAFSLVLSLVSSRPGLKGAITEDRSTLSGGMSEYDLVIENGHQGGMTPLGDTKEKMRPPEAAPSGYGGAAGPTGRLERLKQNPGKLVALVVVVVSSVLLISVLVSFALWSAVGMTTPVTDYLPGQTSIEFNEGDSPMLEVSSPLQDGTLRYVRGETTMLARTVTVSDKGKAIDVLPVPYGAERVAFTVSGPLGNESEEHEFSPSTGFSSMAIDGQSVLDNRIKPRTVSTTEGQVIVNGTGTNLTGVRIWVYPAESNRSGNVKMFKSGNISSESGYLRLDTENGTFAYAEQLSPGTYTVRVELGPSSGPVVYETATLVVDDAPPEPEPPFDRLRIDGTDALTADRSIHVNGTKGETPLVIDGTVRNASRTGVRVAVRSNGTVISRTTLNGSNTTKNTTDVTATYNTSTRTLDYEYHSIPNGSYEVWVATLPKDGSGDNRVEVNVTVGPQPASTESTETPTASPTPTPSPTSTARPTASASSGNTTLISRPTG